jgi:hypothetical protein
MEDTATNNENLESAENTQIPLRLRIPSRMPSVIAQHLTVQPADDGVLLSFYEVVTPTVLNELTEEQIEELKTTGIPAECVSRVFVPISRYEEFLDAMESILPDDDEEDEEGE